MGPDATADVENPTLGCLVIYELDECRLWGASLPWYRVCFFFAFGLREPYMHTYEDVTPGETRRFGSYEVTREEIIEFAESFDPQPFHLGADHDAPFDGVIASGWHTAAMTMRMLVDNYLLEAHTLGSPGLDGLQWRTPVTPGDRLSIELTFGEKEPWDGEKGLVKQDVETHNQDGETVMWMDARCLYRRNAGE